VIKFVSDLRQVGGFLRVLRFPYSIGFNMFGLFYGAQCHFQQYFIFIVVIGFIDGGNRSTRRKPPTGRKSLTNFIT
jgi:hypothetical protein